MVFQGTAFQRLQLAGMLLSLHATQSILIYGMKIIHLALGG
jgi:hypothetical protein